MSRYHHILLAKRWDTSDVIFRGNINTSKHVSNWKKKKKH